MFLQIPFCKLKSKNAMLVTNYTPVLVLLEIIKYEKKFNT